MKLSGALCVLVCLVADSWCANFSTDIAPILLSKCLTCHTADKAKGGYRVHNFAAVLQTGKSKHPAVVPGKPEESELFKRLTTNDEDDRMPQDDDPLSTEQIELFRAWLADGAKLDRGETQMPLAFLIPRAPHPMPPDQYRSAIPILALTFAPDGKQLASAGYHEVLFWTLDGKLTARVTNAPQRIHSIAFQPKAQKARFAVAGGKPGRSGEVSIFEDGSLLTNLVMSADSMLAVAFSPDGTLMAAGGADNSIRVFRTENWEPVTTIQQHADWVTSVAFNPAGTKIISASRDRTARIYDAESGELETTYTAHGATLTTAAFVSEEIAVSGGKERVVHLWDTKEGKRQKEFGEAAGEIYAVLAAGDSLFTASADRNVRQYSVKDRKLVRTFKGSDGPVFAISHDPSHNILAAGNYRGEVNIWNTKDGELQQTFLALPLRPMKELSVVPDVSSQSGKAQ